jgi:1-acyl-sn-glycerol-3-phosphate acyltransferase
MATTVTQQADEIHPQSGDMVHAKLGLRIFRRVLRILFKLFFRVRVIGLENVPERPVIICANHLGWTDAFLVLLFLPIEPRIYILGERQVAHISKFRNAVIRWMEVMVPLDRDKPLEAVREMSAVLKGGGSLLIFPEGKLGMVEGELQPLQQGAPHLSLHTRTPILPVGLTGPSELWLRRSLTVRIGKPIEPVHFNGDLRTKMSTLTWQLQREMCALLPGDTGPEPKVKILNKWLTELL